MILLNTTQFLLWVSVWHQASSPNSSSDVCFCSSTVFTRLKTQPSCVETRTSIRKTSFWISCVRPAQQSGWQRIKKRDWNGVLDKFLSESLQVGLCLTIQLRLLPLSGGICCWLCKTLSCRHLPAHSWSEQRWLSLITQEKRNTVFCFNLEKVQWVGWGTAAHSLNKWKEGWK